MKKYKIEIQIGYRTFNHFETAENEFDARTKTIELAHKKFSVDKEEIKINNCVISEDKKNSLFGNLDFIKNIFGKFK